MEEELLKWQEKVRSQRESCYELNYFTTLQLLALRRELGRVSNPKLSASISPEILALLQSISAHVSASDVVSAVNQALLESTLRPAPTIEEPSDFLEEEEPAADIAKMLSFSDSSEVLDNEIKAGDMHQCGLTEDDLTEEQKGFITTICRRLDCSRRLVLMSFEQCQEENSTCFDYMSWCAENMDKYSFEEDTSDDESSSDSDEEDSDSSPDSDSEELKYAPGIYMPTISLEQ